MNHYLCILLVRLKERIEIRTLEVRTGSLPNTETIFAIGYYRNVVVAVNSVDEAHRLIAAEITNGVIDWRDSETERLSQREAEGRVGRQCQTPDQTGVWYRSGRGFFPGD